MWSSVKELLEQEIGDHRVVGSSGLEEHLADLQDLEIRAHEVEISILAGCGTLFLNV